MKSTGNSTGGSAEGGGTAMLLEDIITKDFVTLRAESSLEDALRGFLAKRVEGFPVVDEGGKLVGYLPLCRLVRGLVEEGRLSAPVEPYMVTDVIKLRPDLMYEQVAEIVKTSPVGSAPVVDDYKQPVGVLVKLNMVLAALARESQARAQLTSVFNALHNGVITVDRKALIVMLNDSAASLLGVHPDEVVGRPIVEILPGFDCGGVLRTGRHSVGIKYTLKNGASLLFNVAAIEENGRIIGANAVFQDLTELERVGRELNVVKELQEILSTVIDTSYEGIVVVDTDGKIKFVNRVMVEFLGLRTEELIDGYIRDVIPDADTNLPPWRVSPGISDVKRIQGKYVVVSATPIFQESNHPVGVIFRVFFSENKLVEELAWKLGSLERQVSYYKRQAPCYTERSVKASDKEKSFDCLVTKNAGMLNLKEEAKQVARGTSSVLITGESGTGKGLFARAVHAAGPRASGPFVKVNCAAIPETLLESELFGYAPGAFTGALKSGKPGRFEMAKGGTIFLDEIGDLPVTLQGKLLQVLQDREFMRVGGTKSRKTDARVIAATNKDLKEALDKGAFRADLYYRLNVIDIFIPPLRDRKDDIPLLVEYFVQKYNLILGAHVTGTSDEAMGCLLSYSWPGNVRELENAVERAVNYAWNGQIRPQHLPPSLARTPDVAPQHSLYRDRLSSMDRDLLLEALHACDGNKSRAAKMLNLSRTSFYEKLAKYGLKTDNQATQKSCHKSCDT